MEKLSICQSYPENQPNSFVFYHVGSRSGAELKYKKGHYLVYQLSIVIKTQMDWDTEAKGK